MSRESINKLLSAWRDQGLVTLEGRIVTIVDLPGLRGLADMEA
jgi:hypothetical protein